MAVTDIISFPALPFGPVPTQSLAAFAARSNAAASMAGIANKTKQWRSLRRRNVRRISCV